MILLVCNWWKRRYKLVRSPILTLVDDVTASAFRLAPEREDVLAAICAQRDIKMVIEDTRGFAIRVSLVNHDIYLPIAAMEYVWAQCLRFWVVAQEYKICQHSGADKFDLQGSERLRQAASLVDWSGKNIQNTGKESWPKGLPRPEAKRNEDVQTTNELFLGALGWIILHEIGHVERNHAEISGTYSQQQEREADLFATEWVMGGIESSDARFNKRAFCIAAALLCLQSFETVAAPRWNGTHPPANERISYCLQPYRNDADERVTAFMVVCLQALFAETDMPIDVHGTNYGEILDGLFLSIGRRNS